VAIARPVLEALSKQTGMMVNLQVLESDQSRVIDVIRPQRLEMISHLRDELLPVHRFAGPLVLVAMLDAEARRPYLRLAQEAGYPLDGSDGLRADIDRAQRSGYALERGRNEKLIASVSQAVTAAKGPPICALTIVGPDAEFEEPKLSQMKADLAAATARLQHAFTALSPTAAGTPDATATPDTPTAGA